MAPPNRGNPKATASKSYQRSSQTSTPLPAFNDQTLSLSGFPSLSIPYPPLQDPNNVFAYNPAPNSIDQQHQHPGSGYSSIFPTVDLHQQSQAQNQSGFTSPASPSPQYISVDPATLFTDMTAFDSMYPSDSPLSSKTSSGSRPGSMDMAFGQHHQQLQQHGDYPNLGMATRSPYTQDSMDMDTSSGYTTYNFSQSLDVDVDEDDEEDAPPPHTPLPAATLASSKTAYHTTPTPKEKEQNKQKLYRNRKSEFTNRMRDELLAMNLLPHSRVTHAPEIMSKTADTLRDYRELLTLIRQSVDGMPENIAGVPAAVRKMLTDQGATGFRPAAQPITSAQATGVYRGMDSKVPLANLSMLQPPPGQYRGVRQF